MNRRGLRRRRQRNQLTAIAFENLVSEIEIRLETCSEELREDYSDLTLERFGRKLAELAAVTIRTARPRPSDVSIEEVDR